MPPMKIVFFGTPQFAVPTLEALIASHHRVTLVVAQPDKPAGRGMKMQTPPVIEVARGHGIPTLQPPKIRNDEFLDRIRAEAPDAGVVVAYGKILPAALLAIPKHGFINVHGSLLPKYRGAAPIQRAIEAGETKTGITIMKLDEEMDHGPVLATEEIPIGPDDRTPEVFSKLAAAGGPLLVRTLDAIEEGRAREIEQQHELATHAAKIEKNESLVDWTLPAKRIYDRFRAFDPWPGLAASLHGETVKLLEISAASGHAAAPGTIIGLENEKVDVATSDGAIRIAKLQRAGKKPATAAEVIRSFGLRVGDRFA